MVSPSDVIDTAIATGQRKVGLSTRSHGRLAVSAFLAGCFIALGGVLSLVVGFGFPSVTAVNPAMQKLLSGAMFPIGLILVVMLGAELFTGNNALLVPAYMRRHYTSMDVAVNWTLVYLGNFAGAIAFTYFMVYCCGLSSSAPYHDSIIAIAEAKVSMPWGVVLLKGIGANWCVCLAVWLAMSSRSVTGKMLGCWLPVMAFVALGYEHSIANMFFIPLGMLEGASVGVGEAVWRNLVPATIGNIIGGAVMVGMLHYYVHFRRQNDSETSR